MKPFLGTEKKPNKEPSLPNGQALLASSIEQSDWSRYEKQAKNLTASLHKGIFSPTVYYVLHFFFFVGAWRFGARFFRHVELDGFSSAVVRQPLLFSACILFILLALGLFFYTGKRLHKNLEKPTTQSDLAEVLRSEEEIRRELGIPEDYDTVDVLLFPYKKPADNEPDPEPKSPCLNYSMALFKDETNLYLADMQQKFAFPLKSLTRIRTINRSISLEKWNKPEAFSESKTARINNLKVTFSGKIKIPHYHILEAEIDGEIYGIYFPNYECPTFETVTRIPARKIARP